MIATICLAVQDVSVKSTAKRLGIPLSYTNREGKEMHKNAQLLIEEIEKLAEHKGARTIALGVAKQWNMRFRNGVIHDGQPISEKEPRRILDATNDLLDELNAVKHE